MKKFLFSTAIILTLTQTLAFAVLDGDFLGDTLVIGGMMLRDPDKLSVNISGGDIQGSGWDKDFLEKNFTKGKYKHILYEHVGYSLMKCSDEEFADPYKLAKAHFDLLQPGGTFDFLSWGYVFDDGDLGDYSSTVKLLLNAGHVLKCDENDHENYPSRKTKYGAMILQIDGDISSVPVYYTKGIAELNDRLESTVCALGEVGFRNIRLQLEKNGVLGFTRSHDSLHISAIKPQ